MIKVLGQNKVFLISLFIIFICVVFAFSIYSVKAETNASVIGAAQILNTSHSFDFAGHSSNVAINNDSHLFSGYAWDEDVGWVAFGTADNPDGPVVFNTATGAVSGKAKILNTGHLLDFNSTPYSSNVIIASNGSFSGYAWSEDSGWINFSGVSVPEIDFGSRVLPETGTIINMFKNNPIFFISFVVLMLAVLVISFLSKIIEARKPI